VFALTRGLTLMAIGWTLLIGGAIGLIALDLDAQHAANLSGGVMLGFVATVSGQAIRELDRRIEELKRSHS
jgi:hypothetical protein